MVAKDFLNKVLAFFIMVNNEKSLANPTFLPTYADRFWMDE